MFKLITRDKLIYLRDSEKAGKVRVYDAETMKLKRIVEPVVDFEPRFNPERRI